MSKVAKRRDKLAELKALKASGKKAFDAYEVQQDDDLYEEVDENQYKKIVRDRLNQDDFVVDDNGEGYADDGREEWDRVHNYESDSEDERVIRGHDRKGGELHQTNPLVLAARLTHEYTDKRKRDEDKAKRDANDRDISEYFTKGRTAPQPKPKV
jgi:DNA polymerase alpha subunit A